MFIRTAFCLLTLWNSQCLLNFFYSHKRTDGMNAISYLLQISILLLGRINSNTHHEFKSICIYICSDKCNRYRSNVVSAIVSGMQFQYCILTQAQNTGPHGTVRKNTEYSPSGIPCWFSNFAFIIQTISFYKGLKWGCFILCSIKYGTGTELSDIQGVYLIILYLGSSFLKGGSWNFFSK